MRKLFTIGLISCLLGVLSCASEPSSSVQTGEGEGVVESYTPGNDRILVEHGEISEMMGPMTMEFTVDDASLLDGLKKGDKIRMTIEARPPSDWVIIKVLKLAD